MPLRAQHDSEETLRWVEKQAIRMDSLLDHAIRSQEPINMLMVMSRLYANFDAVALVGLYCTEARTAAEQGRYFCDFVNFKLDRDPNTIMIRTTSARLEAQRLLHAVEGCRQRRPKESGGFKPIDIIQADARFAEADIADGLAAQDFHILTQKTEHAIRILYDVEHIAAALDACQDVVDAANEAIKQCRLIVSAQNWVEARKASDIALYYIEKIKQAACR